MSQLVKCTCIHEGQDEMYGKGTRVANTMRTGQLKCTVCGTVHGTSSISTTTKVKAKETVPAPAKKNDEKPEKKKSMKGGKR